MPKHCGLGRQHVLHARLVETGPGLAVIEITPLDEEAPDTPWACWNRIGLFEGAPEIWNLPHARVEHHECMHHPTHPSPKCVYRIHYRERSTEVWLPTAGMAGADRLCAQHARTTLLAGSILAVHGTRGHFK